MSTKAFLTVLLLLPSVAMAQGVPADADAIKLFMFYHKNYIQNMGSMQQLDIFRDGPVLQGFIQLSGIGTTTATTPAKVMAAAQGVADDVRERFAIPADYRWVVEEGGLRNRKPIEMTASDRRSVAFMLMIDKVPVKRALIEVTFDMEGRTRIITISVPPLRPEIVAAVRGRSITPDQARAAIQADADTMPPVNDMMIAPKKPVKLVDLKKVAIPKPPYIVYETYLEAAHYTVDATTGKVMDRMSLQTP